MSNPIPRYLLPDHHDVRDGELHLGGRSVLDIVQEFGTPIFIYDEQHLIDRCDEAVAAFPDGVAYASKAFLCREMARLAAGRGMRIDVASGGELFVALSAGVAPEQIVVHGNNKSTAELRAAIDAGVGLIVIDSFDEIERIESIAKRPVECLLRVTPGIEVHTHEYVMTGQDDSKFGFGLSNGDAKRAIDTAVRSASIDLVGLHAHIGSLVFDTGPYARAVELLAPLVEEFSLRELCIGGGLGVAYVEGERSDSLSDWGRVVQDAMTAFGSTGTVKITAEPGRAIVAGAAVTVYTVGTIKEIPGVRTYVSVDGGMSDNPRPILYGSGYETFLARDVGADRDMTVDVVGKHCESGDFVAKNARIPSTTEVGDLLVTPVTGAYGMTMSSNYNKVPRPPVIFVRDGDARVVVRRETHDDLVRLDL